MIEGRRRSGRGELIEDPDEIARLHQLLLDRVGLKKAGRLGLRVNVDRQPTHDELKVPLAGRGMISIELD